MSGFNLAELLPFYLDETDENIAALNDSLLHLEQDPMDVKALQEAFRMFHSIKGASVVMGFQPVNQLTHHLESLFEELRSKKRELDRSILDLTFRCLDELRDYHRDLRAQGNSSVDLSELVTQVIAYLKSSAPTEKISAPKAGLALAPAPSLPALPPAVKVSPDTGGTQTFDPFQESGKISLTVFFQPHLPLADMKARLVLNRLSTRARILSTVPSVEQLDEVDPLTKFTVYLSGDANVDDLRSLADVEGVAEIQIEPSPGDSLHAPVNTVDESQTKPERMPSPITLEHPVATEFEPIAAPNPTSKISPTSTDESSPGKPPVARSKTKIVETIRVESDRLDHLMNLAGELVITKARFVAIARGLDELFRGSNARALTSDTRERLESLTRGLEGLAELKNGSSAGSLDRWSVHVRQLRDNFRAIQDELNLIREARDRKSVV